MGFVILGDGSGCKCVVYSRFFIGSGKFGFNEFVVGYYRIGLSVRFLT